MPRPVDGPDSTRRFPAWLMPLALAALLLRIGLAFVDEPQTAASAGGGSFHFGTSTGP